MGTYPRASGDGENGGGYCVVVKFQDEDAFVLTAYLTNKVRRGPVIWRAK